MNKKKIAAILMIIHGACMEIGGVFCLLPVLILGTDKFDVSKYFSFKLQYFQDNLNMMIIMGAIYGILRVIGAIGLLKNKMWGLALSFINCCITLIVMMFMLPAGIMDGVFAGAALVFLLLDYYGNKEIGE